MAHFVRTEATMTKVEMAIIIDVENVLVFCYGKFNQNQFQDL